MNRPTITPTAILWFDNSPRHSLDDKIAAGAAHFQRKYGRTPSVCMVHPSMLPPTPFPTGEVEIYCAGMRVQPKRFILPNHIWIGVVDVEPAAEGGQS